MASTATSDLGRSLSRNGDAMLDRLRQVPGVWWRRLCLALLAIWLVFSLAQLFWLLLPSPSVPEPPLQLPQNAIVEGQTTASSAGVDIGKLVNYELFGRSLAPVEAAPVKQPPEEVFADTRLKLTLYGAMPSNRDVASAALIGDGPKQKLYLVGEELEVSPRGVKLAKVMSDRVILDNNGNFETLWLHQEKDPRTAQRARPSYQPNNVQAGRVPYEPVDQTASQDGDTLSQPEDNNSEEFVASVRPQDGQSAPTADQIRTITDVFNVSMYREGGQFIGYRIRPKGNRELFDQLGLQANDVVTAVNNVSLDDTNKAMQVYRSLAQESRASLEILRDGSTVTVDIALD